MKQKKSSGSHPVGNRTVVGIICIVVALAICFGIAPLVNRLSDGKTEIVRLIKDVPAGATIAETDIEVVEVGSYNLPSAVITDKTQVIGKCAMVNLSAGEYLLPGKVGDDLNNAQSILESLDTKHKAISITISSFAGGLSGKLENGDVISLVVFENDTHKAIIPAGLNYVKVITTTTKDGFDKDEVTPNEDGTYELPTTLTLLVNPEQAKMLVQYENTGIIYAELVYRGDSKTAQKFLDAQDRYFESMEEAEEPGEGGDI